jgi:acyl-CoA reductase-like NAD-dependent aldehyde dehydrogenase
MATKYLNDRQLSGLKKLGDIILPGDSELPAFSKTGFELHVDRICKYMNQDDLEGIELLLSIFSWLPSLAIRILLKIAQKPRGEGSLAALFRQLDIGLKGIIFTLYYSNLETANEKAKNIHSVIGWDSQIASYPEEDEMFEKTDQFRLQGQMGDSSEAVMSRAVLSQPAVRELTVKRRLHYIKNLRRYILRNREKITDLIQKEAQKTKTDILVSEIFGVLDHLAFLEKFSERILKDEKVHTPVALLGKKSRIYYEPLGTVLIISPWNYPFYQAIVPITSAFVTGNTVVYKPSEITPLEGLLEEIFTACGFEKEWVQVCYGDGKVGAELIDLRPEKIFFTGSVATGKKIMTQAAKQLIPVELELGGKDPAIVFEDASLERAVRGCLWGALTNSGQSCTSVEQVFIQESIFLEFKKMLLKEVKKIRQSNCDNGAVEIGHMTSPMQIKIVADHLEDALAKGANLLHGDSWDRKSAAIPPLVLDNITEEMKIYRDETFGPIIPLISFISEREVVDRCNRSQFGLSASVWSKDLKRCDRVARSLITGNVSINNVMLTEGNPALPFGGVKNSGIGRYKGAAGLHGFCNQKSILIDGHSEKCEVNWYPYTQKKYSGFDKMMEALFSPGILNFIKFALIGMKLESYSDKAAKKKKVPTP